MLWIDAGALYPSEHSMHACYETKIESLSQRFTLLAGAVFLKPGGLLKQSKSVLEAGFLYF